MNVNVRTYTCVCFYISIYIHTYIHTQDVYKYMKIVKYMEAYFNLLFILYIHVLLKKLLEPST
jgi:hypothetical protein